MRKCMCSAELECKNCNHLICFHNVVVERNKPTNMAYRVMRIKLGRNGLLLPQLRAAVRHVKVKVMDETDFGGSNFVDAKQSSDDCEYTHDRFDVMAAREDEP